MLTFFSNHFTLYTENSMIKLSEYVVTKQLLYYKFFMIVMVQLLYQLLMFFL